MQPELQNYEDYQREWARSLAAPDAFWAEIAATFTWETPWEHVREGDFSGHVELRWFEGGKTNLAYNCLDRHLDDKADHPAIIFEPNDPSEGERRLSFRELHEEVQRFANVLLELGVQRGDRVGLYMPNVPEAAIAMLACVRIGAIHSVVFGGFSAQALADRLNDCEMKVLITADSTYRGLKEVRLKDIADEALQQVSAVEHVVVLKRTGNEVAMQAGRDYWWDDLMSTAADVCPPVWLASEEPSFILYTSGSTGKPKGLVHSTGGYMVYVGYTFRNVFQPRPGDLYWCTADVGWITGHSYLVYGPLLNGITTLMFEGVPTWPDAGRFWAIVDQYQVNLFYTAPTAIRALESYGLEPLADKSLASLRVIGTVGEPINWEAWQWYYKHVGRERCSVVDTYWQTETGGIVISPLGNLTPQKPTYATLPLPGIEPALLDEHGNEIPGPQNGEAEAEGRLCFKRPWPGIARTTWGDHQRFINTYFSTFPGYYFTGDSARRDAQGFYRITGRVDDVINVSGHRIGTAEVESALDQHPEIIESAVVGYPHEVKGNALYAFVILGPDAASSEHDRIAQEAQAYVKEQIGSFARPEHIQFVSGLPKTRSGKIMRRILRKLTEGKPDELGDTSTLLNPDCVEEIQQHLKVGPARA